MQRACDPGQTIRDRSRRVDENLSHDQKREMDSGVSRSSLVHGTQTSPNSDTWYDSDAFLLDQVKEVLNKLSEGSIDDEIWGKIVIMERCKRVAKAYLRKTTIIIDGSEDEFDGRTLGFNHFENQARDEYAKEICGKVADGVILKMDYQGNIKGMARGATPIICQGWKDTRTTCISDRLIRLHGKLNQGGTEDEKAYKVFEMRKFKHSLERELHDGVPDVKTLLLKTCLRIALVKDGGDMTRTPCWFAIVNLVALDMLKEKIPTIESLLNGTPIPISLPPTPVTSDGLDAQTLTQIIAAAVSQANKGLTTNNNNAAQNLSISPEQLAQLASTISIAQSSTLRTADLVTIGKKDIRKKSYHCSTSSLDSSGEDSFNKRPEVAIKSRAKRWEQEGKAVEQETKIMEKSRVTRAHRPLLQDAIFTRSQSTTSDYDSNKDHFDSGSWSSTQSRYRDERSTTSSVVSEHEINSRSRDELKEISEIKEANDTTDEEDNQTTKTNSPVPSPLPPPVTKVPTLPRKDYHNKIQSPVHVFSQLPKLEGTATWTPKTTRLADDLPSPPPLPKTPQPGLAASHQYNNNNAFHSYPAYYDRQEMVNLVSELHPRNSQEMEIYFGRVPVQSDQRRNQSVPFVSELRQMDHALPATTLSNPERIPICGNSQPISTPPPIPTAPVPPAEGKPQCERILKLLDTNHQEACDEQQSSSSNKLTANDQDPSSSTTCQINTETTTSSLHCVAIKRQQFESIAQAHYPGVNGST